MSSEDATTVALAAIQSGIDSSDPFFELLRPYPNAASTVTLTLTLTLTLDTNPNPRH